MHIVVKAGSLALFCLRFQYLSLSSCVYLCVMIFPLVFIVDVYARIFLVIKHSCYLLRQIRQMSKGLYDCK